MKWIDKAKRNVDSHNLPKADYSHFMFTTVNGAINTFTEYAMTKGSHPDGRMTTDEVQTLLIWILACHENNFINAFRVEDLREAFYLGREIERINERGIPVFKRPTFNGYLKEISDSVKKKYSGQDVETIMVAPTYSFVIDREAKIIRSNVITHDEIIQEIDKVRWEISRVYNVALERVTADLRIKLLY